MEKKKEIRVSSKGMPIAEIIKRYTLLIIGLFFISLAIALITKARLGVSPISSLPNTLSMVTGISLGTLMFLVNMAMLLLQKVLLKKEFKRSYLLQIPMSVVFGFFIDLVMYLFQNLQLNNYVLRFSFLLMGCFSIAFGIALEVHAQTTVLPVEGLVKAIAANTGKEFGVVKTIFDICLVSLSTLLSVLFLHKIEGLREGTFIAAIIVGLISKVFIEKLSFIQYILSGSYEKEKVSQEEAA